jgi:GT2 family glycosyltransferase
MNVETDLFPWTDPHFDVRPRVSGKFLYSGDRKLWVRGVTYGTFGPLPNGEDYPSDEVIEGDFAMMRANAANAVRCYTVPPRRLLDIAQRHGLRVMVGLPWEQHIAFIDEDGRADDIVRRVREGVRSCAGHPAVLCYAIGNEIPASIVRWHGRRRIERFLKRLYVAAKKEDPDALITYVNFPTTEFLRLPFLDFFCFNVYLESRASLEGYLDRLQNLAGEKPLLMAEIGLDSRRNGVDRQAECLDWQVRTPFAAGCAGAFVFAWTDEWHRGGYDIEDWDFGLVTRERKPKPALAAVRNTFCEVPFPIESDWPHITVVVCSFNGARTIRDTMEGLKKLEYPNFDVIVVSDGSTDHTPKIVAEYDVRLIITENRGLSAARNIGWQEATGEIVAYIDDDAWPDPHWLHYIAYRFMNGDWVGVGGPNIAPPGDGMIADCVANAPGGPVHVLVSDIEAEHIPGCNMAFRREALAAIGGFDERYRVAGDDVDLCWRLQDRGGRIGFHAGAMEWHHRRNSLKVYWRQQKGYGKAEALLEEKWPDRYTPAGHLTWAGRLYGRGYMGPIPFGRSRVYHGVWGSAGYQSLYEPATITPLWVPLLPEWFFVIAALAMLSLLGLSWAPLLWATPLLVLAAGYPIAHSAFAATRAQFPISAKSSVERVQRWVLTFCMHMLQPLGRLYGRTRHGLTPWRRRCSGPQWASAARTTIWSETWRAPDKWLKQFETAARNQGMIVSRGGDFDRWDLQIRGGLFGSVAIHVAIEEHGAGRQLVRVRLCPRVSATSLSVGAFFSAIAIAAVMDSAFVAAAFSFAIVVLLAWRTLEDCKAAADGWMHALGKIDSADGPTEAPR